MGAWNYLLISLLGSSLAVAGDPQMLAERVMTCEIRCNTEPGKTVTLTDITGYYFHDFCGLESMSFEQQNARIGPATSNSKTKNITPINTHYAINMTPKPKPVLGPKDLKNPDAPRAIRGYLRQAPTYMTYHGPLVEKTYLSRDLPALGGTNAEGILQVVTVKCIWEELPRPWVPRIQHSPSPPPPPPSPKPKPSPSPKPSPKPSPTPPPPPSPPPPREVAMCEVMTPRPITFLREFQPILRTVAVPPLLPISPWVDDEPPPPSPTPSPSPEMSPTPPPPPPEPSPKPLELKIEDPKKPVIFIIDASGSLADEPVGGGAKPIDALESLIKNTFQKIQDDRPVAIVVMQDGNAQGVVTLTPKKDFNFEDFFATQVRTLPDRPHQHLVNALRSVEALGKDAEVFIVSDFVMGEVEIDGAKSLIKNAKTKLNIINFDSSDRKKFTEDGPIEFSYQQQRSRDEIGTKKDRRKLAKEIAEKTGGTYVEVVSSETGFNIDQASQQVNLEEDKKPGSGGAR